MFALLDFDWKRDILDVTILPVILITTRFAAIEDTIKALRRSFVLLLAVKRSVSSGTITKKDVYADKTDVGFKRPVTLCWAALDFLELVA